MAAVAILGVLARFAIGMPEEVVGDRAKEPRAALSGWGIRDLRGFQALTAIGMIDNATRTGFLTFLPFALIAAPFVWLACRKKTQPVRPAAAD